MRASFGDKVFYTVNAVFMSLLAATCLFPLLHVASLSLSDTQAVLSGHVTIWPKGWSFDAYNQLLYETNIVNAFKNSVLITVVGVGLSMLMTTMAAYPLSRKYFYARKTLTMLMVFTMLFGAGMIPTYLVVKSLGLVNTYFAIWLPGMISTYNMLVMKSFFENLPDEIDEAARIDGCGEIRLLVQIVLPLSLPMLATLSLFYGVGFWNAFMNVLIYMNDTSKYNMSVLVQQMVRSQSVLTEMFYAQSDDLGKITPESIKSAGVMLMIIPMLALYPFLQKYFVKGVLIGSIKG